jgi:hypothetical protein
MLAGSQSNHATAPIMSWYGDKQGNGRTQIGFSRPKLMGAVVRVTALFCPVRGALPPHVQNFILNNIDCKSASSTSQVRVGLTRRFVLNIAIRKDPLRSGRGKQPHWVDAQLRSGKKFDELLMVPSRSW